MVVTPAFLGPGSRGLNVSDMGYRVDPSYPYRAGEIKDIQAFFMDHADTADVRRLSNRECISSYGITFVSGYSGMHH